jgi:ABC-type sugar transport system permease subunit
LGIASHSGWQSLTLLCGGIMTANTLRIHSARRWQKYAMPYLFIAVPVISFIVFLLIPMVVSFWWSLNSYSGLQPAQFVGLKNYIDLFTTDRYFLQAAWASDLHWAC